MVERNIETLHLNKDNWKRGPGGHWFVYKAWYTDDIMGEIGYGQTALEATHDLKSKT